MDPLFLFEFDFLKSNFNFTCNILILFIIGLVLSNSEMYLKNCEMSLNKNLLVFLEISFNAVFYTNIIIL